MAGEETKAAEVAEDPELLEDDDSLMGQIKDWVRTQAPWWATSFTVHMVALSTLLLLGPRDGAQARRRRPGLRHGRNHQGRRRSAGAL